MFSKKNTKDEIKSSDSKVVPSLNLISEGTTVNGNISSGHGIRISGRVVGTVDVKGKCILTSSAAIEGDLIAQDADVSGVITGELIITNRLSLRQPSRISGNIRTKVLNVEEGATFEGSCTMSAEPRQKYQNISEFNIRQIAQSKTSQ